MIRPVRLMHLSEITASTNAGCCAPNPQAQGEPLRAPGADSSIPAARSARLVSMLHRKHDLTFQLGQQCPNDVL
jgi:hypothetical protein